MTSKVGKASRANPEWCDIFALKVLPNWWSSIITAMLIHSSYGLVVLDNHYKWNRNTGDYAPRIYRRPWRGTGPWTPAELYGGHFGRAAVRAQPGPCLTAGWCPRTVCPRASRNRAADDRPGLSADNIQAKKKITICMLGKNVISWIFWKFSSFLIKKMCLGSRRFNWRR